MDLGFDNRPWIVPLIKPPGITSFDCVRKLKPLFFNELGRGKGRRKLKIGHFGTLDPFASGLLLIGSGKALKLMSILQNDLSKTYVAKGIIGPGTDTGDSEGETVKTCEVSQEVDLELIKDSSKGLLGKYQQRPPYFSAVKHEGKPLYEYAREGVFIEKPPVERTIYELGVESFDSEKKIATFRTKVSSGTYIRGLWSDILETNGLCGHLVQLCRTDWGQFNISDAVELETVSEQGVKPFLIDPTKILELETISLEGVHISYFSEGRDIITASGQKEGNYWVKDGKELLGLGKVFAKNDQNWLRVKVNFN